MKSLVIAGAIALDLISSPAFAASPADPAPKPGPEVQKLGYYIGSWEGHGETKAGPFGKAGKLSSHMKCSWFAGGYQVVCRGEETGPSGTRGFLNILAYDEETKTYTEYSISSFGEAEYDRGGTLVGNRLTFLVDADAGGERSKFRYTEIHLSPVQLSYQAEMASRDGSWTMLAQGMITKVK